MPIRPGRAYRHFSGPAYTRKDYVAGVPGIRVTFFDMGNSKGDFPIEMSLIVKVTGQIRHNALESARIASNRLLELKAGKDNYHLKILIYPHQILRENAMAMGAGADRISDGMRLSFGKPIGTAARVSAGQTIIILRVAKEFGALAKTALHQATLKLPISCRLVVKKGQELLQ